MQTLLDARTQLRCVHDFRMQHVGLDKRHKRHSVDLRHSIRVHGQPRGDTDASRLPLRAPQETCPSRDVHLKRQRALPTAAPGTLPLRRHATTSIKSSIAQSAVAKGIVPMHFSYAYLDLVVRILVVLYRGVSTAHTYSDDRCIPACSQTASGQRSSTQGAWHWHACRQSTWP